MPPTTPAAWAAHYRQFAAVECPAQPTYVAICQAVAADPELLALHDEIPPAQARANLLLAALHERLLAGVAHPLADYYPTLGGDRAPDAELAGQLRDFALGAQREPIRQHLRSRATQTNETGRCAPLRLALDAIGQQHPCLALFDFGASAGLTLGVDEDGIDFGAFQRGPGRRLQLRCDWRGGLPPAGSAWTLEARAGVDLSPVDVQDADACRWLEACVWAHDVERLQRLRRALAWARDQGPLVSAEADGLRALELWMAGLPAGVQPVLLTSWVLSYFSAAERAAFHARVAALTQARGLIWICAEAPTQHPLPPAHPGPPAATLWSLYGPQGAQPLLWSHPHGTWAQAVAT